jgi:hypothetical protein
MIKEIIQETKFQKDNGTLWTLFDSNNVHVHEILNSIGIHRSACSHCQRRTMAPRRLPLTVRGDMLGDDDETESLSGDEGDW